MISALTAMFGGGFHRLAGVDRAQRRPSAASRPLAVRVRRNRRAAAIALLVGIVIVLASSSGSVRAATGSCAAGTSMNIVAHEDDDLLFLNPSVLHDIQSDRCVVTVFATAGDGGRDSTYWLGREQGSEAAYAEMAGVSAPWTTTTLTMTDGDENSHELWVRTLDGTNVSLVFMRLPDGKGNGDGFDSTSHQSLKKLWESSAPWINSLGDGSSAYTRPELVYVLTALMNEYQPDTIRTQDYAGAFGDGDHSDHHAVARFVKLAQQSYLTSHTVTGYFGYGVSDYPQNVTGSDLTAKEGAFFAYSAHDADGETNTCVSEQTCLETEAGLLYLSWLPREYRIGTPIADAGNDQTVSAGSTVTLDGSASSDPDGDTLSYEWTQIGTPTVTLSDADTATPSFTAPAEATTLTFRLTVNDGVLSDSSEVTITVTPVSDLSITKTDKVDSVNAGSSTTYKIRVTNNGPSSVSGAILTDPSATGLEKTSVTCSATPGQCATDPSVNQLENGSLALPTLAKDAYYEISVSADVTATSGDVSNEASVSTPAGTTDPTPGNNSATDTDTLNHAPLADAGPDQTVNVGDTVKLDASASSDPDGDTLSYSWTQIGGTHVAVSSATSSKPSFTAPAAAGALIFKLTVSDGSLAASDSVTISVLKPKHAPIANAGSNQKVRSNVSVTLDGSASSDPDHDPITYKWEQTGGPTVTLSSAVAAKPSFTAPVAGTLIFNLTVSDGSLTNSDSVTIRVSRDGRLAAKRHRRPQTTLLKMRIRSAKRMVIFRFTGSGGKGKLRFQCRLDRQKFSRCRVYKTYKHLERGRHVFRVRARDASGLADLTLVTKRFKI